jgi:hypothetical protein
VKHTGKSECYSEPGGFFVWTDPFSLSFSVVFFFVSVVIVFVVIHRPFASSQH